MTPKHTLSELLTRRLRHVRQFLGKMETEKPNGWRDAYTACFEEATSLEYHLAIAEAAERQLRTDDLFRSVCRLGMEHDAEVLGL